MRIFIILTLLNAIHYTSFTQYYPTGTIEVRGRFVEQVGDQKRGIANLEFLVAPNGRFKTKQNGDFIFKVGFSNSHLDINILNQDYKIMNPRGGVVELMGEQMVDSKSIIQIEILLMGNHTHPELEEQLHQLERKVKSLERKRQLSKKQINVLSEQIIKNTLEYEDEKYQLQIQISQIQSDLKNQTNRSSILQDSLNLLQIRNKKLNKRVEELTADLFDALAEKYLRQQEHYHHLAAKLEDYLIKTKDLRDWLEHLDDYFLNQQAQQDFIHVIEEYEKAWRFLNNNHKSYLLKVQKEWDNNFVEENLEKTFSFLLNEIHKKTYLGTFQSNAYRPLQDWATGKIGKSKAKKRVKTGSPIAQQEFTSKINQLENMIESTLFHLKHNL